MPLLRYFVYMGCVLVAMLFGANWIWPTEPKPPSSQTASTESPVEQMIRIHSAQRWPEKIEFDTNQPIPALPPAPAVAASAPPPAPVVASNSPLEARAELKPAAAAAPPVKRQARARRYNSRPDYYNQRPDAWRDPWHDPWRDPWRHSKTFASAGPSWSFGRW